VRVVVDANVVVSGLMRLDRPPAALLDAWRDGRFEIALSNELTKEMIQVMGRPHLAARYDRTTAEVDAVRDAILDLAAGSHPPMGDPRDPNDRHVLGAAVGLTADFIVSGDKDLLVLESFEDIPILSPRQFLDRLNELASSAP